MENASKALLMAAGVLIGILILSLAVYLFVSFGSTSAEIHKQNEENQLNEFNAQFTSYEGKEGLTIYDVITVANLATENNKYYEFSTRRPALPILPSNDYYIYVMFGSKRMEFGKDVKSESVTKSYNEIIAEEVSEIREDNTELKQYKCTVQINPNTGSVWMVTFK